jgi:hypothetical protein
MSRFVAINERILAAATALDADAAKLMAAAAAVSEMISAIVFVSAIVLFMSLAAE